MAMTRQAHVPKFGDWDSDDIEFTTYFENARRGKGPGPKKLNPNDPEENPDGFRPRAFQNNELRSQHYGDDSGDYHVVKHHQPRVKLDPHRTNNRKTSSAESSSEKRNSDYPNLRSQHRREPSKHSTAVSHGFAPSPQKAVLKTVNGRQADVPHQGGASLPRFGVWDETNPKSGDGFTIIFSKVKEEKQIAAAKLPKVPTEPTIHISRQRSTRNASPWSQRYCCLFPASE